jgi:hypothetical protein
MSILGKIFNHNRYKKKEYKTNTTKKQKRQRIAFLQDSRNRYAGTISCITKSKKL